MTMNDCYSHCPHSMRSRVCQRYGIRPSVRLSVPAWAHSSKPAAAGLLLWARQAGDLDRLRQQRRENAGSTTLSAYVRSWTETCSLNNNLHNVVKAYKINRSMASILNSNLVINNTSTLISSEHSKTTPFYYMTLHLPWHHSPLGWCQLDNNPSTAI